MQILQNPQASKSKAILLLNISDKGCSTCIILDPQFTGAGNTRSRESKEFPEEE
jgi:hypothetical protein